MRSVSIAFSAQEPYPALSDYPAPVGSRPTPAWAEIPLPSKWQVSNGSDLTFKDALDLDVASLVPAVQPRELKVAVQSSDNYDFRLLNATGTSLLSVERRNN
jgi:hypothetical protein